MNDCKAPRPTILSINNYYYRRGGADTVFLEQNRLLEEDGWQVVPIAMHHQKNRETPWSRYFVDEIEFGEDYSLTEKLLMASRVAYSIQARRHVRRAIEDVNPVVAHAHNVYHHLSPSIFGVLAEYGIPTFLTLHDLKIACPAYKMLTHDGICERCKNGAIWNVVANRCVKNSSALSSLVMFETALHRLLGSYSKHVSRFIVPSRFYLDKLVEWGWPRNRFVYIPNFVDTDNLKPSAAPGKAFVYIGRLGPEKGLPTLIKAAALAGASVRIVGTGPDEDMLRALAEDLRADVQFVGFRHGDELFQIVQDSRALILPSEWYENAPVSIMEAYALGRPIIGAHIGGIPELCREGETGWLFPSGNAEELARVLKTATAMPDSEIVEMGAAGRAWMERDFSPSRYREKLLALYSVAGVPC